MIEADALRRYAEELAYTAHLTSPAVIGAFARVPRERYLGPGPWRIFQPSARSYWTTADADSRHLDHDVLVAIDEARRLNNGQPSVLAFLIQALDVHEGDHAVHVGCHPGLWLGPGAKARTIYLTVAYFPAATSRLDSPGFMSDGTSICCTRKHGARRERRCDPVFECC